MHTPRAICKWKREFIPHHYGNSVLWRLSSTNHYYSVAELLLDERITTGRILFTNRVVRYW